jgi:predicted histone-like DNA-binding protein
MSVQFKSLAKGQPGIAGGGEIKYYATIVRGSKVDLRTLLDDISELNIVHPGAVLGVLEAFLSRVNYHLTNGRAIELGQLGSFYPSISSSSSELSEEVSTSNIQKFKVVFRPSKLLRKRMSLVEFNKVADESSEAAA